MHRLVRHSGQWYLVIPVVLVEAGNDAQVGAALRAVVLGLTCGTRGSRERCTGWCGTPGSGTWSYLWYSWKQGTMHRLVRHSGQWYLVSPVVLVEAGNDAQVGAALRAVVLGL